MAWRDLITNEQRRLLKITARMPLANVANVARCWARTRRR